jgi:hypothetical protein
MPEEVDANGAAAHGGALQDALVGLLPIYGRLPRSGDDR